MENKDGNMLLNGATLKKKILVKSKFGKVSPKQELKAQPGWLP
jgi:hypothetical protein